MDTVAYTDADLEAMAPEAMLVFIEQLAAHLAAAEDRVRQLLDLRVRTYAAARKLDPPLTLRAIAAAAGTSDVTVNRVLQKVG